jgi:hypothetical protein
MPLVPCRGTCSCKVLLRTEKASFFFEGTGGAVAPAEIYLKLGEKRPKLVKEKIHLEGERRNQERNKENKSNGNINYKLWIH